MPLIGENDILDILNVIHSLSARGSSLAISLGLPLHLVNEIERNHPAPVDFLTQVLTHWLKRNYNTQRYGVPSWRLLCAAAASPIGGADPALAEKIASNHRNGRW